MDFSGADRAREDLKRKRDQNGITAQQYTNGLNGIRVLDAQNRWWQPDPSGPGWLFWDGSAWQPGIPPAGQGAPDAAQAQALSAAPPQQTFDQFRAGMMDKETYGRIAKDVPWRERPQRWWDRFSIVLGITAAILWFIYASVIPVFSFVTTFSMSEEFDFISPLLMAGMPMLLVWRRKEIDDLLIPFQSTRSRFSRRMLIGMGLAVPFLTAFILYHVFQISQYPLMWCNLVVGTMVSYALVREPVLAERYKAAARGGASPDLKVPLVVVLLAMFCVRIVLADNCMENVLNARDCMRTTGTAEALSGGVSAGVSTAVNGPTMVQTLSQGGDSGGAEDGGTNDGSGDGGPSDNPELCFDEGF